MMGRGWEMMVIGNGGNNGAMIDDEAMGDDP
jgi:hypothetical protein